MSERRKLIIIGGGEHARVIADAAQTAGDLKVIGFVDPGSCQPMIRQTGLRQFTTDDAALEHVADAWFVLGIGRIGSDALRRQIVERYGLRGARWQAVVHGAAWVSGSATVKAGTVVLAGAVVNTGAVVGVHSIVNTGAIIEHDVKLGDFTMAGPGVVVGGGAEIEDDCYLGLGCRVRDHVTIGRGSVVGMGAVVVAPLPAGVKAIGVPARTR